MKGNKVLLFNVKFRCKNCQCSIKTQVVHLVNRNYEKFLNLIENYTKFETITARYRTFDKLLDLNGEQTYVNCKYQSDANYRIPYTWYFYKQPLHKFPRQLSNLVLQTRFTMKRSVNKQSQQNNSPTAFTLLLIKTSYITNSNYLPLG